MTSSSWATLQWVLIRHHLLDPDDVILIGGDDVVVTKADKHFSDPEWSGSSLTRYFGRFAAVVSAWLVACIRVPVAMEASEPLRHGDHRFAERCLNGLQPLPWCLGTALIP